VEVVALEVDRGELFVRHFDAFGVGARVESGVDLQAGVGGCAGDQVDNDL
jgi:hypothetical protein